MEKALLQETALICITAVEIKEKEEENLAAKARSLRDQGLNMNANR